jgi:pimeloyl-ACP methyl ester carboxylesterase
MPSGIVPSVVDRSAEDPMGFVALTVAVPGGEIFATRRGEGEGPPALLLHGGPGMGAEYLVGLVEELDGLIDGVLPQQRGLEPSTLVGPRDVETHVADAIAVLDHLGWERAWLIGHSWGAHLAMHIAVAHPERARGIIGIETLGAIPDGGAAALNEALVARLTPDERARLDDLLASQAEDDADPVLVREIYMALWPSYAYIHGNVLPPQTLRLELPLEDQPGTMASVHAHFEAGTLERGLPRLGLPALFLHGEGDPLPVSASVDTAALIPGARVQVIEEAGYFSWLERPGVIRAAVESMLQGAG